MIPGLFKEKEKLENLLFKTLNKLSPKFFQGAPQHIVERELKIFEDTYKQIDCIDRDILNIFDNYIKILEKMSENKKITFTKEHLESLKALIAEYVLKGYTIMGAMSTWIGVNELVHNTSTKSLQNMYARLVKVIESKSVIDSWSLSESDQAEIARLEKDKEFVHLLIGYKRYLAEQNDAKKELAAINAELKEIEESTKTPAERKAELEKRKADLEA